MVELRYVRVLPRVEISNFVLRVAQGTAWTHGSSIISLVLWAFALFPTLYIITN